MVYIAPSLLSADFSKLQEEVKDIEQGGAEWLHLDVMDGHFVPNITFGPGLIKALRPHSNLFFDVHLMIENPDKYINEFADAGADMIVVHGKYAKSVFIISEKHNEISKEIMDDMERGVTGIYSYGCYKEKNQMMLMCVVRSREVPTLVEKIKKIDSNAFTTISEVREVCGEGF